MNSAIIVAAGSGKRMGASIPKQFIEINGKTILEHSLTGFVESRLFDEIIIVLSEDYLSVGEEMKSIFNRQNIKLCLGGKERFHSVQNALRQIDTKCMNVLIHDSVRPFYSLELLSSILKDCIVNGNAIPAIELKDSIRKVEENGTTISQERKNYRAVQTPQAFNFEQLKNAYNEDFQESYTDDASVFEQAGNMIHLTKGESSNIKITTPADLDWAKFKLKA